MLHPGTVGTKRYTSDTDYTKSGANLASCAVIVEGTARGLFRTVVDAIGGILSHISIQLISSNLTENKSRFGSAGSLSYA